MLIHYPLGLRVKALHTPVIQRVVLRARNRDEHEILTRLRRCFTTIKSYRKLVVFKIAQAYL